MLRTAALAFAATLAATAFDGRGAPPSVGGCPIFPRDHILNTRIDNLPVHASSSTWIQSIGAASFLRQDWGNNLADNYGIPWTTVTGSQPTVPITYGTDGEDYGDESDPGPLPIPPNAPVEGGGPPYSGDQHVLVIDTTNCMLYELYNAVPINGGTSWQVSSNATFDLRAYALRPAGWTSADAAGLPVFPALVRYEEVEAGAIEHAIRFTALSARGRDLSIGFLGYLWPARHPGPNANTNPALPIYGTRFRLKASFDISGFSAQTQVVLRALKKYGLIFADQGSRWYLSGTSHPSWTGTFFSEIQSVAGSNFEAVDTSGLMLHADSARARQLGALGSTDFDANATSDLVWQDGGSGSTQAWLMNGLTATGIAGLLPAGGGYTITHLGDLNGDAKADLLIRHTDGTVIGWLMNGLTVAGQSTLAPAGSGYTIVKAGDLNGDGKADLLWSHTDGSVQAWLMNGLTVSSTATFVGPGSGWSISQLADLDGDGKFDLIWQHTDGSVQAWLMNGTTVSGIASLAPAGSGWSVVLTGDFNGDGKSDLLWQHTDGRTQAWLMNGLGVTGLASFTPAATGWTPVLAGDINGDGTADLFWQHSSGASQTWLMNGLSVTGLASFVAAGPWSATHLLDLNGDGKKDVFWRNADGSVQAWLMDGLTVTGIASLAPPGSYVMIPTTVVAPPQ